MSRRSPPFLDAGHDPQDPSPWLALYLDCSTPLPDPVKEAWLVDSSSASRQYLLPVVRPLARALIVLIQLLKMVMPRRWSASRALHWVLAEGMKRLLTPEANWLVMRHFHLGAQILAFIARNAPVPVETTPLTPVSLDELKDDLFVKHDINLFNLVIRLNQALRDHGAVLTAVAEPDFSMIAEPTVRLEAMPRGRFNVIDLQTAIECYTPIFQLLLTDRDFWRAANSLQLDETIGLYAATLLGMPQHLILLNNKHPLVPMSTLRAGYRLVLHGLSSEMLHALLTRMKAAQQTAREACIETDEGRAAIDQELARTAV